MILVDVNLLFHAVNRDSPQHAAAKAWFENVMSGSAAIGLPLGGPAGVPAIDNIHTNLRAPAVG